MHLNFEIELFLLKGGERVLEDREPIHVEHIRDRCSPEPGYFSDVVSVVSGVDSPASVNLRGKKGSVSRSSM
jgi:hypothetical protein